MHSTLLLVHSLFRWLVLAVALYAVLRSGSGVATGRAWTGDDRRAGLFLTIALDAQLLFGVSLFAISPLIRRAMADMTGAMRDSSVRFFVAEHPLLMMLAVVLAHLGSVLARRGPTDRVKFVRGAVSYGLAFAVLLAGIPWWRLRSA